MRELSQFQNGNPHYLEQNNVAAGSPHGLDSCGPASCLGSDSDELVDMVACKFNIT